MNAIEIARSMLFGSLSNKGVEFDGQKLPDPEEMALKARLMQTEVGETIMEQENDK